MCGIAAQAGRTELQAMRAMVRTQHHRGPDMDGVWTDPAGRIALGHNRLSIIDLTASGAQPMASFDGHCRIVFNGEIYNYLELRRELSEYPYRTRTDTEVILAAWERWGEQCLSHFVGMFAFALWDSRRQILFAARDRFGVKPLHYSLPAGGGLLLASEIAALHAAGTPAAPDPATWATYLTYGLHDHSDRTFWSGVRALPPGHYLTWQNGTLRQERWYDLAAAAGSDFDARPVDEVAEEYLSLLLASVCLRFRSDVPVGINLSGGLDSSMLLGLVQRLQGEDSEVKAFTYVTGHPDYDELPWVSAMIGQTRHPSLVCRLLPEEVPELARSVMQHEYEPYGGLPTLAYAKLFELARRDGEIVLLDGQGIDEQWAGYDYYRGVADGVATGPVQGSRQRSVRPECLLPAFRALAQPVVPPRPFPDALRNRQYLDTAHVKIPRALRFNDRVSMRSSTELREPFMDHRLFELAFRQPPERKIAGGVSKWLVRRITRTLLPQVVAEAPKRAVQTPQREWLVGPLRPWASECIELGLSVYGGAWLDRAAVRAAWHEYLAGASDNSFYVWQWISLGLSLQTSPNTIS